MNGLDISVSTQQCAQYCNNLKASYKEAVKIYMQVLLRTKDMGLLLKLDKTWGLEWYVDANWEGLWSVLSSTNFYLLNQEPVK